MCPVWLLVIVAVVGVARGDANKCWEHPSCQEVNDEGNMMECIQLCYSELSADPASDPAPDPASDPAPGPAPDKRSYNMEHFRWGKPVGRKRQAVASNSVEEQEEGAGSEEEAAEEARRRDVAAAAAELRDVHQKKDNAYQMKHFRWSSPTAAKHSRALRKRREEEEPAAADLHQR